MAHPRLKDGYEPSISSEKLNTRVLQEEVMDRLKSDFEDECVDPDALYDSLLFRKNFDRQKLLEYFDIVDHLTKDEEEDCKDDFKDALWCLGSFPEYEKRYLINVLSSSKASNEERFRTLEETILSKSPQFLERFIESRTELNTEIVKRLEACPINDNKHVTEAVEKVLGGENSTEKIFTQTHDMYEIGDGGRSLKSTYENCRKKEPRTCFLKNLLLEANDRKNVPLVLKIIFSHCYVDLKSILDEIPENNREESASGFDNPTCSHIKELTCLEDLQGELLKGLAMTAAFGPEE